MDEMQKWLLFLPQVPSTPSSLRVSVWRRMREMGAVTLQNGVWVLPRRSRYEEAFRGLLESIVADGGKGMILEAAPLAPELNGEIAARFLSERDEEYTEFCERCQVFLTEIEKDTLRNKFNFADLEEGEEDLIKLVGWMKKIRDRDFFGGRMAGAATTALDDCHRSFKIFAAAVYAKEGFDPSGD